VPVVVVIVVMKKKQNVFSVVARVTHTQHPLLKALLRASRKAKFLGNKFISPRHTRLFIFAYEL